MFNFIRKKRDLINKMDRLKKREEDLLKQCAMKDGIIQECKMDGKENLEALVVFLEDVLNKLIVDHNYIEVYNYLAEIDVEGWSHLSVVKKLIPCDIYSEFYYEDNMGMFESMNGFDMIKYYEIVRFSQRTWEQAGRTYERISGYSKYADNAEYMEYNRKRIHDTIFEIARRYPIDVSKVIAQTFDAPISA